VGGVGVGRRRTFEVEEAAEAGLEVARAPVARITAPISGIQVVAVVRGMLLCVERAGLHTIGIEIEIEIQRTCDEGGRSLVVVTDSTVSDCHLVPNWTFMVQPRTKLILYSKLIALVQLLVQDYCMFRFQVPRWKRSQGLCVPGCVPVMWTRRPSIWPWQWGWKRCAPQRAGTFPSPPSCIRSPLSLLCVCPYCNMELLQK
jgi:hypothetical protein